jgi:hypothetical protein
VGSGLTQQWRTAVLPPAGAGALTPTKERRNVLPARAFKKMLGRKERGPREEVMSGQTGFYLSYAVTMLMALGTVWLIAKPRI